VNRLKTTVLSLLSAWQWTRRFRQPSCRFYPSCSEYMRQAIEKHGIVHGMRLGVVRICKCHPFHDGGVDEVPEILAAVAPTWNAINVMKSGLKPVFVRSDATIIAQAFCSNRQSAGIAPSAKQAKTARNPQNQPSNTSSNA